MLRVRDMKEILEGHTPIIDSNLVKLEIRNERSLLTIMDGCSMSALRKLDNDTASCLLSELNASYCFLRDHSPHVIPEVLSEIGFLSVALSKKSSIYERVVRNNSPLAAHLANLKSISRRTEVIWEEMSKNIETTDWENYWPKRLLGLAVCKSQDYMEKSIRKHGKSNDFIGYRLQTDAKLVAFTFLKAGEQDVTLISKDEGVLRTAERLKSYFGDNCMIGKDEYPLHGIRTYNLNTGRALQLVPRQTVERKELLNIS